MSDQKILEPVICRCGHTHSNHNDFPPYDCQVYMNATLGACSCRAFEYPKKAVEGKNPSGKFRRYCNKCGLTWFAITENEKCPDCTQ